LTKVLTRHSPEEKRKNTGKHKREKSLKRRRPGGGLVTVNNQNQNRSRSSMPRATKHLGRKKSSRKTRQHRISLTHNKKRKNRGDLGELLWKGV